MPVEIKMPKLGQTMDEGTIISWIKKDGEQVEKGEELLEIETDKATYTIESPESGILNIKADEGDIVPIGETIGVITLQEEKNITSAAPSGSEQVASELDGGKNSPCSCAGDAEAALATAKAEPELRPLSKMRKAIARQMTDSYREIPHFRLTVDVDFKEAGILRERLNNAGQKPSYTAILVKAVAKALAAHPEVNSSYEGEAVKEFKNINIGVAMATAEGLIVPVITDAVKFSIVEIDDRIKELREKAKTLHFANKDLEGATFTVSNLGMYGIDRFDAIIDRPQAAILAVGRITERPVVIDSSINIRPVATFTLSIDHRVLDGAAGAVFLKDLKELIENPTNLI